MHDKIPECKSISKRAFLKGGISFAMGALVFYAQPKLADAQGIKFGIGDSGSVSDASDKGVITYISNKNGEYSILKNGEEIMSKYISKGKMIVKTSRKEV